MTGYSNGAKAKPEMAPRSNNRIAISNFGFRKVSPKRETRFLRLVSGILIIFLLSLFDGVIAVWTGLLVRIEQVDKLLMALLARKQLLFFPFPSLVGLG